MEDNKITMEEANLLSCYILMTTNYRQEEAAAWDRLAQEKNPDGTYIFPNAARQAQYMRKVDKRLTALIQKLDAIR